MTSDAYAYWYEGLCSCPYPSAVRSRIYALVNLFLMSFNTDLYQRSVVSTVVCHLFRAQTIPCTRAHSSPFRHIGRHFISDFDIHVQRMHLKISSVNWWPFWLDLHAFHLNRWMSAISFMGDPVEVYRYGAIYFMLTLGYICGCAMAAPYATKIHRMQIVSIYEVSRSFTFWVDDRKYQIRVYSILGHCNDISTSNLSSWEKGTHLTYILKRMIADYRCLGHISLNVLLLS